MSKIFHALPLADAQWVESKIPERDKCLVVLDVLQHKYAEHISRIPETMQHRKFLPASFTKWPTDHERRAPCFT